MAAQQGADEVMVIGGGQIYQQAIALAQRVYLTRIELELEGDTFFPVLDAEDWQQVSAQAHPAQNDEPGYLLKCGNASRAKFSVYSLANRLVAIRI